MSINDVREFWTLDCETDPFKHGRVPDPFIWGLFTGTSYHEFDKTTELVNFIKDKKVIIYAHNGGRFDFHFLIEHINLEEPVKVINGSLVVSHIGLCELRDSFNLIPVPLSAYQKDNIDYSKMERDVRSEHMTEIRSYLKSDCVYLYNLVREFEAKYGRHLTLAGSALAQWVRISKRKPPRTTQGFFDMFSPFYFGGRVQCFRTGHVSGPLQVYDINSAYPWAMLSSHPYGAEYVVERKTSEFKDTSFVTLKGVSRGALPFRDDNGCISFPDDRDVRKYTVCGHEVLAGIDTGTLDIREINSVTDFCDEISFRDYIEYFFAARQVAKSEGDKANDLFCKLFMNSLYGKFGANPRNYGNFMCVPFHQLEEWEGYEYDGMIGPHALMRAPLEPQQMNFLNVATAASITSQVRSKLWRAICESDGVAYCDTDSIMCEATNEKCSKELGDWKHEGTASDAFIAGKKMYVCYGDFDGGKSKVKMASKGVRLSPEEIEAVAMGEIVSYKAEAPTFRLRGGPVFQERRVRKTA